MGRLRVLVLGGGGMLGHKLVHVFAPDARYEVHATTRRPLREEFACKSATYHSGIDVSSGRLLADCTNEVQPDVIINAIGAIKQKDLNADLHGTFLTNATLPHLLRYLPGCGDAYILHISTDCVFSGTAGHYREADQPDATDVYGYSKQVGELSAHHTTTLRTSIIGFEISGFHGLLSWLFKQSRGAVIPGFRRAVFSGLPTVTLAHSIADLIAGDHLGAGVYHVASTPITKFELAQKVNQAFDLGLTVEPSDQVVIDRSLNDERFRAETRTERPDWDLLVAELKQDYDTLPYDALYQSARTIN